MVYELNQHKGIWIARVYESISFLKERVVWAKGKTPTEAIKKLKLAM